MRRRRTPTKVDLWGPNRQPIGRGQYAKRALPSEGVGSLTTNAAPRREPDGSGDDDRPAGRYDGFDGLPRAGQSDQTGPVDQTRQRRRRWRRIRRLLRRRPRALDAAIALFAALLQFSIAHDIGVSPYLALPVAIGTALALFVRRRFPLGVGILTAVGYGLLLGAPGAAVGMYTLASYHRDRRTVWTVCVLATGLSLSTASVAHAGIGDRIATSIAFVICPAILGLYIGARRTLLENLHERAERLEREQHLLAQQARVEERTRIAREMHDVVAHRVSLIVLHAGALEVAADNPERAAETAELIRGIGREALEELREVIGVLRVGDSTDDAAPLAPQPTVDDIPALVAQSRAAGTDVSLHLSGERRPLSRTVERTAYRVAQEALTNVHKHARGAATTVALRYLPDVLEVCVTNARPLRQHSDLPSGGHGLVGLAERVRLAGGSVEYGPRLDGGFEVRAVLPATEPGPAAGRRS